VAEKFALDEFFRDGGAVDGDHGGVGTFASGMEGAGGQFLAGPVLAGEQDPDVGGGDAGQQFPEFEHDRGLADKLVLFRERRAQRLIFPAQGPGLKRTGRHDDHLFEREGLFDKVVGPLLDGGDGGFDGAVAGDHNYGQAGMIGLELRLRGQAVHARKPDVEENEVRALRIRHGQPFFRRRRFEHFVALILKDAAQGKADGLLVVDDQNACHNAPRSAARPQASESSFRPAMPATIRAMHARRAGEADSPKSSMPSRAVPTAPMPVHTA